LHVASAAEGLAKLSLLNWQYYIPPALTGAYRRCLPLRPPYIGELMDRTDASSDPPWCDRSLGYRSRDALRSFFCAAMCRYTALAPIGMAHAGDGICEWA